MFPENDEPMFGTDAETLAALPNTPHSSDLYTPRAPIGPDISKRNSLAASSAPVGNVLSIKGVGYGPHPSPDPAGEPLNIDVDALLGLPPKREPLLHEKPNGHIGLTREPVDEDFPEWLNKKYGNNFPEKIRFLVEDARTHGVARENIVMQEMIRARDMGGQELPDFYDALQEMNRGQKAGMTEEEYEHWQKRDPNLIANQITDKEILHLSKPGGYATKLATDPNQREMAREDGAFYARAEAHYLVQQGDQLALAEYELRSGFGQVGMFGVRGIAALARLGSDITEWQNTSTIAEARDAWSLGMWDPEAMRRSADEWNEYAKDVQARWVGPVIDTGNPITDFIRTSVFRGTTTISAFAALAAVPGIGTTGSSAIMGALMGGDTYLNLRNDNVSPLLSAGAAGLVSIVSFATTKFTLEHITRYLGGNSPWKLFSVGTGLEVANEAGQEVIENTTQAAAEGLARLIGNPEYTRRKFWADMKEGVLGSLTEGGMAGISTLAMRIIGVPIATRNQIRANTFAKSFIDVGDTIAKTKAFEKVPEVLAASMNNMGKHHGGGPVITSVLQFAQAGITKEQVTAPIADGGLGVKAEIYDKAAATGEDIAVGYGNALVFSQKQKQAGNRKAVDVFAVDPDSMSVGDIRAQRQEAEIVVDKAETFFEQLQQNNEAGMPLRLKVFRAGLKVKGFDSEQADALTSMFWAGAVRHAELWETTTEAWLDDQKVQIAMEQALLGPGRRNVNHYLKLLKELSERNTTPPATAPGSPAPAAPPEIAAAGVPGAQTQAGPASTAASVAPMGDLAGAGNAAQGDVVGAVPLESATTAADQAAWESEAVETVANELAEAAGMPDADRPALVQAVRQAAEAVKPLFDTALPQGEVAAVAEQSPTVGRETDIIFPAETGMSPLAAHYELVEADSLQPSHTPSGFTPNPAWSAESIAQQRNYDSPAMEATRQSIQMSRLDFGALFNPTTDAVNGPPVVMPDGMVLGGNNRTLRILNRYEQDNYKMMLTAQLSSRGNTTGISPEVVEGMKQPVLVRVVDNVAQADIPTLIGALNADFTTRRDAGNLAANRGLRVGSKTLRSFAGIGEQTVSAFLDTPQKGFGVVQAMLAEGVFQETDLPTIFDMSNGKWLPGGKAQVEQALFGAVLPDSRLLDEMPPAMQRKLLKALPALVRLKAAGSPELESLFQAVRWHNEYQAFRETALGKQFKTEAARLEAFRRPDMANMFTGVVEAEKSGPAWDMLVEMQKAKSQKEVAEFFTRKADEISGINRGLFSLQQGPVNGDSSTTAKVTLLKMRKPLDLRAVQPVADKAGVENTFRSFGPVANKMDGRVVIFPVTSAGKIASHRGFDTKKIAGDLGSLFADSIPMLSEEEIFKEGHKRHDNVAAYHHYVSKFMFNGEDGKPANYYIRFTVREIKSRKGKGEHFVHSTFISDVSIYEESALSAWGRVSNPVITESGASIDTKLAQWLSSVKSDEPNGDASAGPPAIETLYQAPSNTFDTITQLAESNNPVNSKQAKFDVVPTLAATTEGIAAIPDGSGFSGRLVEWARQNNIIGTFENADTGWQDIAVTATSIRDVNSHKAGPGKLAVLQVLPGLIRDGVFLETTQRNEHEHFSHIFAGKVSVDGTYYVVGFVINEDYNGKRYYNHELTEIKKAPSALWPEDANISRTATDREPVSSILRRHLNVNPDTPFIETLYQSDRGEISFAADATIIQLFKGADVSTVVHELNHLFLNDLIKLVRAGKGGERARQHLAALTAFTNDDLLSDDENRRRNGFEKIASAWERYAMDGIAPSNALEDPFAVFRKYITRAYQHSLEELVEPSPAVRRVFDAMLATDEQIEAAARRREKRDDWSKQGKSSENVRRKMEQINARRDDRRRKRQDAATGGGRQMRHESVLDARRRVIRGQLSEEPVYRAIDIAKAKNGMNRANAVAAIGEAAVARIEEIHGPGIFAENYGDGVAMAEVAAMAGYSADTIADMLVDIAAAESMDVKAERETREAQDRSDTLEDTALDEQDELEGIDEDADESVDEPDSYSPGDMTDTLENSADTTDMIEEVEAALEDEVTDGGRDESLARKRELQRRLQDWRDERAILSRQAREEALSKEMRNATDIRSYRKEKTKARRRAYEALERGDRAAVTRWKRKELYHHFQIVAARQARKLRERIKSKYSPGALKSLMDAAEHQAKIEYEYTQAIAQLALYAGMADSRLLKERADGLGKTLALPKESPDLAGVVTNIEDTLEDWLLNMERPEGFKDFRDFTVEQLFEIDRLMRWLIDNGQGKLAAIADREAANLNQLVTKSTEPMGRRDNLESTGGKDARTRWNRTLNSINRFLISLTLPENWFMAMDGNPTIQGKEMGINQRLFRSMVDADVAQGMLHESMMETLKPHFDVLNTEMKDWEKRVGGKFAHIKGLHMPEVMKIGRGVHTYDFDMLLSIALQMGNDANMRRMLTDAEFDARFGTKITPEGGQDMAAPRYNYTNAEMAIVAGQFSADAWRAIQGILDGVNSLYGDADAVTFILTNRHVVKEKPTAHTVSTSDGEVLHLKGGYFPLVNDPMLSTRGRELNEKTNIEEMIHAGLVNNIQGATRREVGAIKGRARNEEGTPMTTMPQMLSSSILIRHIDVMANYITHAGILRDMDRMTRNNNWRNTYTDKFGQEQYKAVRLWLKNLAMPERGSNSPGGIFIERMRGLATVNALGLRWKTGLKQRLGAFQGANYMTDASMTKSSGWKWLKVGVMELGFTGNLGFTNAKIEFINEKSDFMRVRAGNFDREVKAMRDKLSPLHREYFGKSAGEWQNLAFAWIQANDQGMAAAVWLGAYRQALADEANIDIKKLHQEGLEAGKSEAEINNDIDALAVNYADSAAATQASSFAADLTEIQRDHGFMRFVSMFMSGNVRQGSRLLQYLDARSMGDKTTADVAMLAVREFVFPSLAWVFVAAAVKYAAAAAFGLGDDDDDSLLAGALWESLDTATAPFPLLRDIPRGFRYGILSGDVPALRGPMRAIGNITGAPGRVMSGEYMRAVGQLMDAAGFVTGIPVMNPLNDTGISEVAGLKKRR